MSVADFAKNRRDLRDPKDLGELVLGLRAYWPALTLSAASDKHPSKLRGALDYKDETAIEKYGDPRKLPSTLPN